MRSGAFVRVLVVALLLAASSAAQAAELTDARVQQDRLQEQLQATVDELSALQSRTAVFEVRRDELGSQLSRLQAELSDTQVRLNDRVRRLYAHGVTSPAVMMLGAESPTDAMERAAFAARLMRDDRVTMQQVAAQRRQIEAVATRLAQEQRALDEVTDRQQEVSRQLQQRLEEAATTVAGLEEAQRLEEARRLEAQRLEAQRLDEQRRLAEQRTREEAERRRMNEQQRQRSEPVGPRPLRQAARVPSPPPPPPVVRPKPPPPPRPGPGGGGSDGGYSCPLGRPRAFSNDWGAPRSGGRSHRGTDIFAPYGANVVAIVDGVVSLRGYGESAGWWLILRGADGTAYWYLHLQRYAIADGARVSAGQLIASNGDTGNAKGTSPHVHFEQHPGGGGAVNPYPLLKRVCG